MSFSSITRSLFCYFYPLLQFQTFAHVFSFPLKATASWGCGRHGGWEPVLGRALGRQKCPPSSLLMTVDLNLTRSLVTLNVNGLNTSNEKVEITNAIVPLCFIFHFHAKLAIPAAVVWGLPVHSPHLVLFSRCLSSVCVCHFLSPSKSHLHTSTEVYYFFFSSPKSFCSFLTCWKMSLLEPTSNIFSVFLSPIFFCSSSFVHILIIPSPNYQDKWGKARVDDGDQQRGWSTGLRWWQWRWRTVDKLC